MCIRDRLERETIQKRVTDAYYSRSQRGFKMGGKAPYGFHTEPIKMDGINTKKDVYKRQPVRCIEGLDHDPHMTPSEVEKRNRSLGSKKSILT